MMPNTGSGMCLRKAYSVLPCYVCSRCAIAASGVASSGGGGVRSEARGERGMVRLPPHRNQRFNACRHTGLHVCLTEVASVGQQCFDLAQLRRQRRQLVQQ